MLEARLRERRIIPAGMWARQNSSGSPKLIVSTPPPRRYAAAARPCGPAPIITVVPARRRAGIRHASLSFVARGMLRPPRAGLLRPGPVLRLLAPAGRRGRAPAQDHGPENTDGRRRGEVSRPPAPTTRARAGLARADASRQRPPSGSERRCAPRRVGPSVGPTASQPTGSTAGRRPRRRARATRTGGD